MAKRTYTPDEYQSQFVDFYNINYFIDVAVAPQRRDREVHEEKKHEKMTRPSECFDACVGTG